MRRISGFDTIRDMGVLDTLEARRPPIYCLQRQDLNGLLLGFGCPGEDSVPAAVPARCDCLPGACPR